MVCVTLKCVSPCKTYNKYYVKLRLEAVTTKYRLHPQHAVSNTDVGNNAPRYISDSASDPFNENLIKILSVVDISAEKPIDLLLNDTADPTAVRTVAYDTLMVKNPMDGQIMEVEYVAAHPSLSIPVDVTETINLVPALHEALELYVAAKVYGAMNGEENRVRALSLMAQYEAVCRLVEEEDILQLTVSDTNTRFTTKGFV